MQSPFCFVSTTFINYIPISYLFINIICSCKSDEKETTTPKIWGRLAEYKQWDQQRHMSETTTINIEGQLEEWKLKQKVLEMESNRFGTILDILKIHK